MLAQQAQNDGVDQMVDGYLNEARAMLPEADWDEQGDEEGTFGWDMEGWIESVAVTSSDGRAGG